MFKTIVSVSIFGILTLGIPTPAKAVDPVADFVAGYLGGALVDEVWDRATSKPDVRLLDQRLKDLEQNAVLHSEMRKEVAKLRAVITKSITRDEFRTMAEQVNGEIGAIKRRLDSLENRVERLEVENEDLKAGTKNVSSATYFVQRAVQLDKNRETDRALANLNIALKIDPACVIAYRVRFEIFARGKAWGVVLADTTEAITQLKRPEAWFFRERALARSHVWGLRPCRFTYGKSYTKSPMIHDDDLKTFNEDCLRALTDNPSDVAVLSVRGLSRIHQGNKIEPPFSGNYSIDDMLKRQTEIKRPFFLGAFADLNTAVKFDPRSATAFCCRGVANISLAYSQGAITRSEYLKAAVADFTESIRLDPNQKEAYASRAEISIDPVSILDDLNKAHALDPTDMDILYERATAYGGSDNHKAIADWLQMTKLDPTYQHAYYMLGIVYYNVGDKESASRYRAIANEMEKDQKGN